MLESLLSICEEGNERFWFSCVSFILPADNMFIFPPGFLSDGSRFDGPRSIKKKM